MSFQQALAQNLSVEAKEPKSKTSKGKKKLAKAPAWWDKLSRKQQLNYIKENENTKLKKFLKKKASPSSDKKPKVTFVPPKPVGWDSLSKAQKRVVFEAAKPNSTFRNNVADHLEKGKPEFLQKINSTFGPKTKGQLAATIKEGLTGKDNTNKSTKPASEEEKKKLLNTAGKVMLGGGIATAGATAAGFALKDLDVKSILSLYPGGGVPLTRQANDLDFFEQLSVDTGKFFNDMSTATENGMTTIKKAVESLGEADTYQPIVEALGGDKPINEYLEQALTGAKEVMGNIGDSISSAGEEVGKTIMDGLSFVQNLVTPEAAEAAAGVVKEVIKTVASTTPYHVKVFASIRRDLSLIVAEPNNRVEDMTDDQLIELYYNKLLDLVKSGELKHENLSFLN